MNRQRLRVSTITVSVLACGGIGRAATRDNEVDRSQPAGIAELQKSASAGLEFFKQVQLRRSQVPIIATAQAEGITGGTSRMSYAAALAAVAKDHGFTAGALRGMLDTFADRVSADTDAGSYDCAAGAFHRRNFSSAASLAAAAASNAEKEGKEKREAAIEAWTLAGDSEMEQVHFRQALAAYQKALALADKAADPKRWTDLAMHAAGMHDELAEWKEAAALYREIVELRERHYGSNALELADALNNHALILQKAKGNDDPEPLLRRALKIEESASGSDPPRVAIRLNNLAQLLHDAGNLKEAEELMRRALKMDGDSPAAAVKSGNLALFLVESSRFDEAEPLLRRALAINEASFGREHPEVATALGELAVLLSRMGKLEETGEMLRRAQQIDETFFGKDHPRVARDLQNLAGHLYLTNRRSEAEALMRRAAEILEKSLGASHPHVASVLAALGMSLMLQGDSRLAEAEPLLRRALAIDEATYGKDHPGIVIHLRNLAHLLRKTKRLADAEPIARRAVASALLWRNSTAHEHPNFKLCSSIYIGILSDKGLSDLEQRAKLESLAEELHLEKSRVIAQFAPVLGPFDVTVTEVIESGQGPALGIRPGDILRKYNNQPVTKVDQATKLTGETTGDAIAVEIQRGAETLHLKAKGGRLGLRLENRTPVKEK